MLRTILSVVSIGLLAASAWAQGKSVMLNVTADCGVTSTRDKQRYSNGTGPTAPIRQNQNWSGFENKDLLVKFDTSAIKGWTVTKAVLHLYVARNDLFGVGVCTVLGDWREGSAMNGAESPGAPCWDFASTPKPGEKPGPQHLWGWPGTELHSVCWSHPTAIFSHAGPKQIEREAFYPSTQPAEAGVYRPSYVHLKIPVSPDVVHAMAAGLCHGVVLTDDKGQVAESYSLLGDGYPYRANDAEDPIVFTKDIQEPKLRPRLEVFGEAADKTPPAAPANVKVASTDPADGCVTLEFTAPGGDGDKGAAVLGYEVRCTSAAGKEIAPRLLPRWEMPRPVAPGQTQRMPIFSLPPAQYDLEVMAVDQAGNRSQPAKIQITVPAKPTAALKKADKPAGTVAANAAWKADQILAGVASDMVKVDPVTGAVLAAGESYRTEDTGLAQGTMWDGAAVRLPAAANEVVAFQIILAAPKEPLTNVKLAAGELLGPGGKKIGAENTQFFRVWYVNSERRKRDEAGPGGLDDTRERSSNWYGDACLPLKAPFDETLAVPAPDNKVTGQKFQAVWVDLYVPRGTPPGAYKGAIQFTCDQAKGPQAVNVEVSVLPLALPETNTFSIEINRYNSMAGFTGLDGKDPAKLRQAIRDYYALAHQHRSVLNCLPYTHSSRVDADYIPTMTGSGTQLRAADWANWDALFTPLLDGSAFAPEKGYVGPGAGVPISKMYLALHEGWPMPVNAETYKFWYDVKDRVTFAHYAKNAGRIAEGFTKEYQDGWVAVGKAFFEHFKQKGWNRTSFEIFGNNKYYYKAGYFSAAGGRGGVSFWLFDEPSDFDDYDANAFLMQLGRRSMAAAGAEKDVKALYRVDVSQVEMSRGLWDNVVNCWYVGGLVRHAATAQARLRWIPNEEYWNYGGGGGVTSAPAATAQNILSYWTMGAVGNMPYWDNFRGSGAAWQKGDDLAIYYIGKNYANSGKNYPGPIAGVRLKVLRRIQQDMEYLHLLAAKPGWNRSAVRQALSAYADDPQAPVLSFTKLSLEKLEELRRAVAATAMEK